MRPPFDSIFENRLKVLAVRGQVLSYLLVYAKNAPEVFRGIYHETYEF